jgi:hypothetical protein
MLLTHPALIIVLGGLAIGEKNNLRWRDYTPNGGEYVVQFPAEIAESATEENGLVAHSASLKEPLNGIVLVAMSLKKPSTAISSEGVDFVLRKHINDITNRSKGKVLSERACQLAGAPAREVIVQALDGRVVLYRATTWEDVICAFAAVAEDRDSLQSQLVRQFFDSIRLPKYQTPMLVDESRNRSSFPPPFVIVSVCLLGFILFGRPVVTWLLKKRIKTDRQ